jgi:hypothetical protein
MWLVRHGCQNKAILRQELKTHEFVIYISYGGVGEQHKNIESVFVLQLSYKYIKFSMTLASGNFSVILQIGKIPTPSVSKYKMF